MRRFRRLSRWAANQKPAASRKSVPTMSASNMVPAELYAADGISPVAAWPVLPLEPGSVVVDLATAPRAVAVNVTSSPGRDDVR